MRARTGYDVTGAPNEGRFMAEVLLDLADRYRSRAPGGAPFRVRQERFFPAFLRTTGLSADEAPPSFRMARRFGQTIVVEYRTDRVVDGVKAGPEPEQALAVRITWPDSAGLPSSYTYEDTASEPDIRLKHERVITYRLLDYDSLVVYDRVDGISGRPTSGVLGALFAVLGMADFEETRFTVAEDGTQVTLARVDKIFDFEAVATVSPEGRARRGVPEDRPDLKRLENVLREELELEYAASPPAPCPGPDGGAGEGSRRTERGRDRGAGSPRPGVHTTEHGADR